MIQRHSGILIRLYTVKMDSFYVIVPLETDSGDILWKFSFKHEAYGVLLIKIVNCNTNTSFSGSLKMQWHLEKIVPINHFSLLQHLQSWVGKGTVTMELSVKIVFLQSVKASADLLLPLHQTEQWAWEGKSSLVSLDLMFSLHREIAIFIFFLLFFPHLSVRHLINALKKMPKCHCCWMRNLTFWCFPPWLNACLTDGAWWFAVIFLLNIALTLMQLFVIPAGFSQNL